MAAVAALSYASPYWTLHQLKVAAQETNAETMNKHIDYPALRDSLKSQMRAVMNKEVGSALLAADDSQDGNTAGALGASMGAMFAGAMLDQFVDALVTPEAIAEMMTKGNDPDSGTASFGVFKQDGRTYMLLAVNYPEYVLFRHLCPLVEGEIETTADVA